MTNPKLRFRSSEGDLVEDWKSVKVGDIAETCGGGTPATGNSSYWDGSIQWLTPTEIDTKYVHDSKRTITLQGLKNSSAKLLPKGAIVLTTRATLGACSINNFEGDVCTNQGFQSLIGKPLVDSEFLYYVVTSQRFQRELKKKASGSTFLEVSPSNLRKIIVAIPSKQEQCRVADFFSTLDEKIALAERKLATLQTLKSGVMQKIFSREIRFKREDGSDFPEWKKSTLAEVSVMVTVGIANAARHAYCDAENGIPMLRNMNIKPNRLDDSDLVYITKDFANNYSKKTLAENDVLVCRTGVPGTACLVPKKYVGAQTFTTLIVRLLSSVEPRYVCQYINSPLAKKYIDSTTIGGGQKNSGAGIISTLPIALPCKEEQQRIADILVDADAKIKNADTKLALLNRQKQAFMLQMFV